jgi:hypothetical protein
LPRSSRGALPAAGGSSEGPAVFCLPLRSGGLQAGTL